MKRRTLLIALFIMLTSLVTSAQHNVHPTRYNWTNVANTITQGCTNDYDRVKAIYRWMCANISYDTSYSIYHADECWDNKRGVCQAYSELFYYIAQAAGIRVDIISGRSKDITGNLGDHSWIYAETDRVRHAGVLIDPTWGAGSVNNGVFERSVNDMSWFHVNPYLMVCTHLPKDASYQLLETPVSSDDFYRLPPLYPVLEEFGFDAKELFEHCKRNPNDFPAYYSNNGNAPLYIEEIPLQKRLRTGHTYRFAIRRKEADFVIICNDKWTHCRDWQYNNGVYTLDYTVPCGEELKLSWYDNKADTYYTAFCYDIATPTADDLRRLEAVAPQDMPEVSNLPGINSQFALEMGFNFRELLKAVRNGSVTHLPDLYNKELIEVIDVPLNGTLTAGQAYRFRIKPKNSGKWAIINNNEWAHDWTASNNGNELEIIFTPKSGTLKVTAQKGSDNSYHTCLEYKVR